MNALDLLLVQAAATYSPPEPKAPVVKEPKAPKAVKVEIVTSVAAALPKRGPGRPRKTPQPETVEVKGEESNDQPKAANPLAGIEVGSLTAAQFLTVLHQAGKKDPNQENWDIKKAIHGFCGYHLNQPQGTQLDNAVRVAKTKINGVIAEKPKPSITVAGYVAGLPDQTKKQVDDLLGRLNLAYDTKKEYLAKAGDKSLPIEVRKSWAAQAGLEQSRVDSIKTQLRALGH